MTQRGAPPSNLLPQEEQERLSTLYQDGAWTHHEIRTAFTTERIGALIQAQIIGQQDTEMGPMYHLLAQGRIEVFGGLTWSRTLTHQLNVAYVRLCMKDLGWKFADKATPFYRGFDKLFPTLEFREAETSLGRVLLSGKLDGGGYTPKGIERLMRQVKSTALAHHLTFVILTPHARRGQNKAQQHRSVLQLVSHLPQTTGTNVTRFNPVKAPAAPPNPDPVLTSVGAQQQRQRGVIPNLTLDILQLSHKDRVERAQAALETDHVLSAAQLSRYYGVNPSDMNGRLITQAILRPSKNRTGLEVRQRIVAADRRAARLDDGHLNHRLTTAQIRLNLGIGADPERWIVESRNTLRLDDPDAVYITADGEQWAIEADTGQYDLPTVLRKAQAFRDQSYARVVWGATSEVRVRNLTKKITADLRPTVQLAQWW